MSNLHNLLDFENLEGGFLALKRAVAEGKSSSVFYTAQNARCHIAQGLDKFFLYITPDRVSARAAVELLTDYSGGRVVLIPEKDDVVLNVKTNVNESLSERMSALTEILKGRAIGAVVSAEGLLQYLPSKKLFSESLITLKRGDEISYDALADSLINGGYRREETVTAKGCFSSRGDIFDIWTVNGELPVRVEFFGDTIESLRVFAPESMMSVREIRELDISPRSDMPLGKEETEALKHRLLHARRASRIRRLSEILDENIAALESGGGAQQWTLPFIKENMSTVLDYIPDGAVVIFDETKAVNDKLCLFINAHNIRVASFAEEGEATLKHKESILSRESIYKALEKRVKISFQNITSANPVFEPRAIFNIKALPISKYNANFDLMVSDIKGILAGGARILIYTGDDDTAASMKNAFLDYGLSSEITVDKKESAAEILLIPKRVSKGFLYPAEHIMLIGTDDIKRRPLERKKRLLSGKREFFIPEKGDYVVHSIHGIGLSEGIVQIETKNVKRDYYLISYKDGDKLYLPTEQMDSLEKYTGGGAPALHRLGGKEFERVKERVKNSIKAFTMDLLSLYEKRLNGKGHKYQSDTVWQKEMEDAFEYTETDDQLTAAAEIKEDMEQGKIMDRLLCGDVGFGKTEVAIRAIFKTIIEGKQAAILSPTTILCQQHYNTISQRLKPYGIKIDILSRFVSTEYLRAALKRIKNGETSVIVATHRLLSKDVVFKDLGLLVLDEEQRFGVEHKEKIKVLKANVNVLTMSATPVPRTLHMALSGIRDISTLDTPPKNRLPVETYVVEYSDALVKDAVKRELGRGGQVFILYNKVSSIIQYYRHLEEILDDNNANIIYAHGQMDSGELEERIRAFYNKEANVLLATTIIENGIDLPDANTLIVIDADLLGLSEMYQLRGRVGRSYNLAYAYFTVREGKVLTENAQKRLDAILNNTELGSGFKIAMQDLEIRGAGNILGREQHGNMEKVGYDMYCRLLNECISEMKGEKIRAKREVEIVTDGEAVLPREYITDGNQRVKFYKMIAALSSFEEENALLDGLRDIYGKPPVSVRSLSGIGLIKNLCADIGVQKITMTAETTELGFYGNEVFANENVMRALSEMPSEAYLNPSNPPAAIFKNASALIDKIARIKKFLAFLQ